VIHSKDPCAVVQRQLDAYNAKDLDAWLSTYAPDAEQFTLHGELLAQGHDALRARIVTRFQEPNLHARLIRRTAIGNVVVDAEEVTRNFAEGLGTIEMLCIYEVVEGRIARASFALGKKTILVGLVGTA
jgi:hypothetical protein